MVLTVNTTDSNIDPNGTSIISYLKEMYLVKVYLHSISREKEV